MEIVLLPTDGSESSFSATLYVIDFVKKYGPVVVHVANIQPEPLLLRGHGMSHDAADQEFSAESYSALKPTLHALEEAQIAHQMHVRFGNTAETLVALAEELGCDHIVMGTRGLGGVSGILLGSVTREVLHLASIPVVCIKGEHSGLL